MEMRTIAVLTAACSPLFSTAGAETALHATGRPTAGDQLPSVKKDCDTYHLPARTHTAGTLKKKLSSLCLDCHPDRKAPTEHKVDIVPKMMVRGLPLADGKVTASPATIRMRTSTVACSG
jgi:predicted CXXCH cytochrome family protein